MVKGDLHYHSMHSSCQFHKAGEVVDYKSSCGVGAVEELIELGEIAYKQGYQYIGVTNHPQAPQAKTPATKHETDMLLGHLYHIKRLNSARRPAGIKLLAGAEVNILNEQGQLSLPNRVLKKLDLVIASIHRSSQRLSRAEIRNAYRTVAGNQNVHIIGHLTRFITKLTHEDWRAVVESCERHDKIIEYNTNTPLTQPALQLVVNSRLRIALGTDTHPEMIHFEKKKFISRSIANGERIIKKLERLGIDRSRIINTYSWPRLKKLLHIAR